MFLSSIYGFRIISWHLTVDCSFVMLVCLQTDQCHVPVFTNVNLSYRSCDNLANFRDIGHHFLFLQRLISQLFAYFFVIKRAVYCSSIPL